MDANLPSAEDAVMLPIVITQVDAVYGCVVGLTRDGRFFRPEPAMLDDVSGTHPYYRFGNPVHCRLGPSQASDPRPEDRALLERLPVVEEIAEWRGEALEPWFASHRDKSVEAIFSDDRSVGLIRAQAETLRLIRSTRGRFLILLGFTDEDNQHYEWVVPELPFSKLMTAILQDAEDAEQVAQQIVDCLRQTSLFLALVLSKPRPNAVGSIRGCQPLVGGVHSFPAYADILAERFPAAGSVKEAANSE